MERRTVRGLVMGAVIGAVAGGLLTLFLIFGLMGSGHGGPLEGTVLELVAWALVLPGVLLGEGLGLGTLGWIVGCALPYATIGALVAALLMSWRRARLDRRPALPQSVPLAEPDTEAPTGPWGPRTAASLEGDNDG